MKQLIPVLICVSTFAFSACKKDRVCKCTVSTFGNTHTRASSMAIGIDTTFVTPLNTSNENEVTYRKVTKRQAKNNCISKDDEFSDKTTNSIPGVFSLEVTNTGTREYDCELE